ncbi:MAG: ECF transporter S component [Oscillospiraceae bacterium]|nr:ECF transporter S component [Oscillospiraceae bacterium]
MSRNKRLVLTGLCVAIGVALPIAFHSIPNAGGIFLPMHLPVLLCGLICGPVYGLICGILAPLLSSLLTGMPPAAMLPSMLCELAVYGLVSGLLMKTVKTGNSLANIYISLIGAMLAGRLTYGVLNALIFRAGAYSMQLWLSAAFVTSLPGIAGQLILIPLLLTALKKAKLIEPGT